MYILNLAMELHQLLSALFSHLKNEGIGLLIQRSVPFSFYFIWFCLASSNSPSPKGYICLDNQALHFFIL